VAFENANWFVELQHKPSSSSVQGNTISLCFISQKNGWNQHRHCLVWIAHIDIIVSMMCVAGITSCRTHSSQVERRLLQRRPSGADAVSIWFREFAAAVREVVVDLLRSESLHWKQTNDVGKQKRDTYFRFRDHFAEERRFDEFSIEITCDINYLPKLQSQPTVDLEWADNIDL